MIIHYINADYSDGDWSGVGRFDHELHKVFPDLKTATRVRGDLGKYLKLNEDIIVITDNGWCLDIPNKFKCIAVHHGIAKSHKEREPGWGGNVYISTQQKMTKRKGTIFVGVSTFCTNEAKKHYGIDGNPPIINSVDTKPKWNRKKSYTILGDWRDSNKGNNIKNKISGWKFKQLKCGMYDKQAGYEGASIYLNLSLCEGNSYSMLDAIACNIPVLGTDVGLYGADYNPMCGEVISWKDKNNIELIKNKLDYMYENYDNYEPREWLLKYNSFDLWKNKWKELLK